MSDPPAPGSETTVDAYVDAAAAILGLDIAPYRPQVIDHFARLHAMARALEAFDLDITDEPASRFEPGREA